MNILFLTDNFPPEVNAPATRTFEHCREWAAIGCHVTVITCAPNFPHGRLYNGYKNKICQTETMEGIRVVRVWSYMAPNSGFLKRVVDYFSFAVTSFVFGVFQKCDVIIATSPQFFTTWSGWALSKVKRKPWIFELRDLWPESIKTVGAMKQGKIISFLERVELGLYKDCDKVVAVTSAFKDNLVYRGVPGSNIQVITNGVNMELFYPRPPNEHLLDDLKIREKFVVGYIGTHGMAHSLDFVVRAIGKILDPCIHFLFIGDGAMKNDIVKISEDLHLKNISFLDSVSKDMVPEYLSVIDVSLVPLKKDDNFKTVIPSKIFESSGMRKPVLLGVEGHACDIVTKYGSGVCFEPENEEDFVLSLLKLKNKDIYKTLQDGCRKLSGDYDRKKLAAEMLDIANEVVIKRLN